MASTAVTMSVAQIQSLALKTLGFRDDTEVLVRRRDVMDSEVEFDIYHCRVVLFHDGQWQVYSRDKNGDTDHLLNHGNAPDFIEGRKLW